MSWVDPQVTDLVAQLAQVQAAHVADLSIEEARGFGTATFAAVAPPARTLARVEDIEVPGPDGPIPCRVHVPVGGDGGPLPVVLLFIGGTFVLTGPDALGGLPSVLADEVGAVVVVPTHRLPPEHPFPASFDDCFAVYRWALDHAGEIGGDPARIAVMGESSGATLAAAVTIDARDAGLPQPRYQVLAEPLVDHESEAPSLQQHDILLDRRAVRYGSGLLLGDRPWPVRASPLRTQDLAGLAPAYVVTAELDCLHDDGHAYVARLRAAGVPVTHCCYEGQVHGFVAMSGLFASGLVALHQLAGALRLALR